MFSPGAQWREELEQEYQHSQEETHMARGRQQETFEASGVIEAVARTQKAFKIGEEWYSVFETGQMNGAQKGDEVEFEYSVASKGGKDFLNVQGDLVVVGQEAPQRRPAARQAPAREGGSANKDDPRQRSIVRQNSLTQANAILATAGRAGTLGELSIEDLAAEAIALARLFEAYSMG